MEPVSALAFVCNIIDLVVTTGRICALLRDVHQNQCFPNHDELSSSASLLELQYEALEKSIQAHQANIDKEDKELVNVSLKSRKLALDFKSKLEALQVKPTDRRAERLNKLLKTVLQRGKVYDLQRRWEELRDAVDSAVIIRLNQRSELFAAESMQKFDQLAAQSEQARLLVDQLHLSLKTEHGQTRREVAKEAQLGRDHTTMQVRSVQRSIAAASRFDRKHTSVEGEKTRKITRQEAVDIRGHNTKEATTTRSVLGRKLESIEGRMGEQRKHGRLLDSVKFPQMNHRYNQIMEPTSGTFAWIFEGPPSSQFASKRASIRRGVWDSFREWLSLPAKMYWINGKAGSGKSSLMRYICTHRKTRSFLREWSANGEVIVISWFFWNSGSQLQRSLIGTLASLLHQIWVAQPAITGAILKAYPELHTKDAISDWSLTELFMVLTFTLENLNVHLAMFIDGLDEFDQQDDFVRLFALLTSLSEREKVKICVSSRPEHRLELRLSHMPTLKLQDLTADDIETAAYERLRAASSTYEEPGLRRLAESIRRRSEGVFLWAHYVTESVSRGIENDDDEATLISRLKNMPTSIRGLYAQMWLALNGDENLDAYRHQINMFFALRLHWPLDECTLTQFTMATNDRLRESVLSDEGSPADLHAWLEGCRKAQKQLKTRCAGLLEVVEEKYKYVDPEDALLFSSVEFFHRTARDFLLEFLSGDEFINAGCLTPKELTPRIVTVFTAAEILVNVLSIMRNRYLSSDFSDGADTFQLYAMVDFITDEPTYGEPLTPLNEQFKWLNLLARAYATRIQPLNNDDMCTDNRGRWVRWCHPTNPHELDFWGCVATLLTTPHVSYLLDNKPEQEKQDYATYLLSNFCLSTTFTRHTLRIIEALIDAGARPRGTRNLSYMNLRSPSSWMHFLQQAYTHVRSGIILADPWINVICKFLACGALMGDTVLYVERGQNSTSSWGPYYYDYTPLRKSSYGSQDGVALLLHVNASYFLTEIMASLSDGLSKSKVAEALKKGFEEPFCNPVLVGHWREWWTIPSDSLRVRTLELISLRQQVCNSLENDIIERTNHETNQCMELEIRGKGEKVEPHIYLKLHGFWDENIDGEASKKSHEPFSEEDWSAMYCRTRDELRTISQSDVFVKDGTFHLEHTLDYTEFSFASLIDRLTQFHDLFGSLNNGCYGEKRVREILGDLWHNICKESDSHFQEFANPRDILTQELFEMINLLQLHGLVDFSFKGQNFTYESDGKWLYHAA